MPDEPNGVAQPAQEVAEPVAEPQQPESQPQDAPQPSSPVDGLAGKPIDDLTAEDLETLSDPKAMDAYLATLREQRVAPAQEPAMVDETPPADDGGTDDDDQQEEQQQEEIPLATRPRVQTWPEVERLALSIRAERGCSLEEALAHAKEIFKGKEDETPKDDAQPVTDAVSAAQEKVVAAKARLAEAKANFEDDTDLIEALLEAKLELKEAIRQRDSQGEEDKRQWDSTFDTALKEANARYPDAEKAGSPLNAKIAKVMAYFERATPSIFDNPNYPLIVAATAYSELLADAERSRGSTPGPAGNGGNGQSPLRRATGAGAPASRPAAPIGPAGAGTTPPLTREQFLRKLDQIDDPEEIDRLVQIVGTKPDAVLRRGR